jgi:YegS/Rv2252/BmrU family lipid kinase
LNLGDILNIYIVKTSNIQFVVNPVAGSGKAKLVASSILDRIGNKTGSNINVTYTKGKNDATLVTREAIINHAGLIVAVGGDGTINEVVNGFFNDEKQIDPSCELGIINCGTGMGYAGTLNIPRSLDSQIELLLSSSSVDLDLGNITCHDQTGNLISRLFVNECQTGIGSRVTSFVGKKSKMLGGTIAFGFAATIQALIMNSVKLEIAFENEPYQQFLLIGLVVGNGKECAGGMKLTPGAEMDDGFFDVLLIHEMSRIKRLINLPQVYSGTHIQSPGFSVKRCKNLKISSNSKMSLEADGEIIGFAPFEVNILPSAIKVKAG